MKLGEKALIKVRSNECFWLMPRAFHLPSHILLVFFSQATPDYAYGAGGFAAWGIMPNSPLNFEIEVLSIK